jgi:hypothetical protein
MELEKDNSMYSSKLIFLAVFALLATLAIADVTGKFNIVSKYKHEKTDKNGHKTIEEIRNPLLYEKKNLKSDKTLSKMVKDFGTWSNNEFHCSKARNGPAYNVAATQVYANKDASTAANNKAKQIINSHANDE